MLDKILSYLEAMAQSFEGLESVIMPMWVIAGVICHVPELRIFHIVCAGEQKLRERDCDVLGECRSHRQPQTLQKGFGKASPQKRVLAPAGSHLPGDLSPVPAEDVWE